jgi:AcrR family transcriptional regulator
MRTRTTAPIAPRRRPTQARSERTVELLLEAAARVLEEKGIEGYTTNAVAERCGVSVGSLYQYFPNKDSITSALVLKAHRQIVQHLDALRERIAGLPLQQAIEAMVQGAVLDSLAAPRLSKLLEFEEERLPRGAELDALERAIHEGVMALLQPHVLPTLTPAQLSNVAHRMIGIVQGMVDRETQWPSGEEPPQSAVARAVIGYLQPVLRRH